MSHNETSARRRFRLSLAHILTRQWDIVRYQIVCQHQLDLSTQRGGGGLTPTARSQEADCGPIRGRNDWGPVPWDVDEEGEGRDVIGPGIGPPTVLADLVGGVRWVWVLVCRRLAGCYPWSKAPYCSPVYSLQPAKPNVRSATVVPLTFSDGIGLST